MKTPPDTNPSVDKTIVTWMGAPLEEMSKQELIGAVRQIGKLLVDARDNHDRTFRMWEMCRKARK